MTSEMPLKKATSNVMTGLTPTLEAEMIRVFQQLPAIQKVLLFGSRAMGTHRDGSDIDLAIEGDRLELTDVLNLHTRLDDLGYPYSFDVHILSQIQNEALKAHIKDVGVTIYSNS